MAVMTRENIMDKIRKLIALSGSSNVHEAEVAAAAAQRLMLEYKIAESDITVETTEEDIVMDAELYRDLHLKAPPRWHSLLLNAVARANFCSLIIDAEITRDGYHLEATRVYQLIGTDEDRLAVKYIYEMLRCDIERLCRDYARMLPFDRADRASFKLGAASSIAERLFREAQAFRAETRRSAHPNAIAVIDKTESALKKFMATRFRDLQPGRPLRASRRSSYDLGREVGRDVDVGRNRRALDAGLKGLPAATS
jgi:hypothetical protein